mgnify:CR=1 FL=1
MSKIIYIFIVCFCFVVIQNLIYAQNSDPLNGVNHDLKEWNNYRDNINPLKEFEKLIAINTVSGHRYNFKNSIEYKLDSILWWDDESRLIGPSEKSQYIMNETQDIVLGWYANEDYSEWIHSNWFTVYHYNDKDQLTEMRNYFWDGRMANWDEAEINIIRKYKYNDNDQLTSLQSQDSEDILNNRVNDFTVQIVYIINICIGPPSKSTPAYAHFS